MHLCPVTPTPLSPRQDVGQPPNSLVSILMVRTIKSVKKESAPRSLLINWKGVLKFVTHSKKVTQIAESLGWRAGARYTNLRDIRGLPFAGVGFIDINWKRYCFSKHLEAVVATTPLLTVARDVEDIAQLPSILAEAEQLSQHASHVVIVPKDPSLCGRIDELIPVRYLLGFSVPTKYGSTPIPTREFQRPVHLLGGRPDVQRHLANEMPVVSVDCNRFTLDAAFGDYFDGVRFRPHPDGGYERCLTESIVNINRIWTGYERGSVKLPVLDK